MAKKVAVLVVNPVNGSGLFQYLETFFENGIPFRTFAVADTTNVKNQLGASPPDGRYNRLTQRP